MIDTGVNRLKRKHGRAGILWFHLTSTIYRDISQPIVQSSSLHHTWQACRVSAEGKGQIINPNPRHEADLLHRAQRRLEFSMSDEACIHFAF